MSDAIIRSTCMVCHGGIVWINADRFGGWWAHDEHPADHHDALSMFELIEDMDDGRRWITIGVAVGGVES